MKKEYEFAVKFFDTNGTFTVEANNLKEADEKAWEMVQKALSQLPVDVEYAVECYKEPDEDEALFHVVLAVDRALNKYDSDNVDVVYNIETGMLDVMYCSGNNSFCIEETNVPLDDINIGELLVELEERDVGYVGR